MASRPVVVIATDSVSLAATTVLWVLENYGEKANEGRGLHIITQASSSLGGDLKLDLSSLDVWVSIAESPAYHNVSLLAELMKFLKPGGILVAQETQLRNAQVKANLEKTLLLAGYVNIEQCPSCAGGAIAVKALKPVWETGASFSLKKTTVVMPQVVKLPTYDANDDYDLIDEDSLLTEEDLKRPELPKALDDCEVGKSGKKACKNCTCGRAEMEAASKLSLTVEDLNNPPQSACGSCGLGDAFRCSTCPYRGMAPFKPGEKITLSGALLMSDV